MTKIEPLNNDREAFQLLLDVYGADRARWPAADRLRFAQLLSKDPLARKMLGEADAFERVLDRAPAVSRERQSALASRLLDVVAAEASKPNVVGTTFPPGGAQYVARSDERTANPSVHRVRGMANKRMAPVAALLAASLAAGVFIGLSGAASPALNSFAEALGGTAADADLEFVLAGDLPSGGDDTL